MANLAPPRLHNGDNSSGSLSVACDVRRSVDADSISAQDIHDSITEAGYVTAGALPTSPQAVEGESIYAGLGVTVQPRRASLKAKLLSQGEQRLNRFFQSWRRREVRVRPLPAGSYVGPPILEGDAPDWPE